MRARPSIAKRSRENDRQERQREKAEKRGLRKELRQGKDAGENGDEDPDIAGIQPGPQKLDPELFGVENLSEHGSLKQD